MTLNVAEIEARWADIVEPENVDAPWIASQNEVRDTEVLDAHYDIRARCQEREVADALAAARTDIPALIARLREVAKALLSCGGLVLSEDAAWHVQEVVRETLGEDYSEHIGEDHWDVI